MPELTSYPPPLDRIDALDLDESDWPEPLDYRSLGIGREHIAALIEIAVDRRYDAAPVPATWAPVHAWRALGALGAVEAIEPLTALLDRAGSDDAILEEVPRALAAIGPASLPTLVQYLEAPKRNVWGRAGAGEAMAYIGERYPELRGDCVTALQNQLRHFATQDDALNGLLVSALLDLNAIEAAPIMEQAYAADRVDPTVAGDWEDVQIDLGLLAQRTTPPRHRDVWIEDARPSRPAEPSRAERDRAAQKKRRKMAKLSKRRNRRRK